MTPDGLDLLDEAVTLLRQRLAPQLSGDLRYVALLTANAVATARREAAIAGQLEMESAGQKAWADAIRCGAHDYDAPLYKQLLRQAALRSWVADPDALTDPERKAYLGEIKT